METQPTPTAGAPQTPLETQAQQNAFAASNEVLSRHAPGARGKPGRPRKDAASMASQPSPGSAKPRSASPAWVLPLETFKGMISKSIGAVDGFCCRKVYFTGMKIGAGEQMAKQLANEVAIEPEQKELFIDLSEALYEKYKNHLEYAPEVGLIAMVACHGYRVRMTLDKLEEIARLNAPVKPPETKPEVKASDGK